MPKLKSYQPISLLSVPSKLLERVILSRINPYVEDILPGTQAGLRPNRSTVHQVTQLTATIENGFERCRKSTAAGIDLTAAYNTVWHRGLRLKLVQSISDKKWYP